MSTTSNNKIFVKMYRAVYAIIILCVYGFISTTKIVYNALLFSPYAPLVKLKYRYTEIVLVLIKTHPGVHLSARLDIG